MSQVAKLLAESERLLTDENRQMRDAILDAYDFERVATAMRAVGWKWRNGVPDAARLRQTATLLLNDTLNDSREGNGTRSGGFEAWKDKDGVSLVFMLEAKAFDRETGEVV